MIVALMLGICRVAGESLIQKWGRASTPMFQIVLGGPIARQGCACVVQTPCMCSPRAGQCAARKPSTTLHAQVARLQVGADAGAVSHHVHAHVLQVPLGAHPREHQDLRRVHGARGQHDLPAGLHADGGGLAAGERPGARLHGTASAVRAQPWSAHVRTGSWW